MKNFLNLKSQITALTKLIVLGLYISIIGLTSSCSQVTNNVTEISNNQPDRANEIVMFCGNPGVGKSSLLNSIVQRKMFESGVSHGQGKTTNRQSCSYNGVTYMDTPGLSDVSLRDQAAKEIERALKEDKNYKIVFVATLESGRIKPDDLTTINLVCESVKVDFKYGIIFNKVSEKVAQQVSNNPTQWAPYIETLAKKPCDILIILRDLNMDDEENALLPVNSENRKKLIDFIAKLPANGIPANAVQPIKAHQYDAINREMEEMMKNLRDELKNVREMNNYLIQQQMEMFKESNRKMHEANKELTDKLLSDSSSCLLM